MLEEKKENIEADSNCKNCVNGKCICNKKKKVDDFFDSFEPPKIENLNQSCELDEDGGCINCSG